MKLNNHSHKKYQTTKTLVYSCQYHVIWCAKYRRKVLTGTIAKRLKEIILENQSEFGYHILEQEIMPDHVHLLIETTPQIGIHKIVSKIKGVSSRQLRDEFPSLKSRLPTLWSRSKFISTVGAVTLDVVKRYIENQKNV